MVRESQTLSVSMLLCMLLWMPTNCAEILRFFELAAVLMMLELGLTL